MGSCRPSSGLGPTLRVRRVVRSASGAAGKEPTKPLPPRFRPVTTAPAPLPVHVTPLQRLAPEEQGAELEPQFKASPAAHRPALPPVASKSARRASVALDRVGCAVGRGWAVGAGTDGRGVGLGDGRGLGCDVGRGERVGNAEGLAVTVGAGVHVCSQTGGLLWISHSLSLSFETRARTYTQHTVDKLLGVPFQRSTGQSK